MDWKRCAAMGLLLLATGCGGEKGKKVSQGEYGQSWPLTVMEGRLSCVWHTGRRQMALISAFPFRACSRV